MPPSQPSSPCASALRPFQRRLRLSAFANQVPVVCAAALGVLTLALLLVRPDARMAALTSTAAIVFALVATWVIALARTPSLAATARLVDARFRLENRTATALQFSGTPDAVAHLVIADALSRLETIPASRLPLDVSPQRWMAVALLASAALVVSTVAGPAQDATRGAAIGDAATGPAVSSPRAVARGVGARETKPGETEGSTAGATPAAAPAPNARGRSGEGGTASPATPQPGNRASGGAAPADVTARAAQLASAPGRPAESTTPEGGDAAGGPDGRGSASGRGAAPGGASGPGRGARAVAAGEAGGGGVTGGALAASASGAQTRAPAARFDAESYRRAYARAEAAIAREQVPAPLRAYVRDYFAAIRQRSAQ